MTADRISLAVALEKSARAYSRLDDCWEDALPAIRESIQLTSDAYSNGRRYLLSTLVTRHALAIQWAFEADDHESLVSFHESLSKLVEQNPKLATHPHVLATQRMHEQSQTKQQPCEF